VPGPDHATQNPQFGDFEDGKKDLPASRAFSTWNL